MRKKANSLKQTYTLNLSYDSEERGYVFYALLKKPGAELVGEVKQEHLVLLTKFIR